MNVTNLIVLGFLRMRPMHGYEIQQLIQQSRMDDWANVLSGSIYYALNKMEQDGLIRAEAEVRTGNRLRKIYAITEEGEAQFREMVRESLTAGPHSVKSDLALGSPGSTPCRRKKRSGCLSGTSSRWSGRGSNG